ncbi:MAG TPA: acyl-homoserine-lactone synthase [Rhizomicrobium sp.]
MLYLVDRRNREEFLPQLEEMFRIRHAIYVEGRGWRAIARADGREIDQFDTEDASYLLGLNEQGGVTSGVRLLPTTGPHLMRDVFAHTVTWGRVPCDARVFEMTRYFVWGDVRGDARRQAVREVFCGIVEYALAHRLSHISVVCDTFFVPRLLEAGWKLHHLGLPTDYPEGVCAAVLLEVTPQRLAEMRARLGASGPALTFSAFPPPNAEGRDDAVAA